MQNGTKFAIQYGSSGPVAGEYSADTMSVGGIDIPGYTFAEADDVSGLGPAYGVGKFDGILGMGWDDISVDGVQTPLRALVESGKLDEPAYAFFLGSGGAAGELTLGGANPARYTGDFHYVPVVEMVPGVTGYWEIVLDDVQVHHHWLLGDRFGRCPSGWIFHQLLQEGRRRLAHPSWLCPVMRSAPLQPNGSFKLAGMLNMKLKKKTASPAKKGGHQPLH